MNWYFTIAQAIGIFAFILGIYGYSQHCEKRLRLIMFLHGLCACLHLLMLGRYSGSFSAGLSGFRNYLSIWFSSKLISIPFILAYIILGIWWMEEWFDILPVIASVFSTYNYFHVKDIKFRINLIIVSILWLTHNLLSFSIGLALMEILMIVSASKVLFKMKNEKIRD